MTLEFIVKGEYVFFTFPFNMEIVRKLKSIPNEYRYYDSENEMWRFKLSEIAIINQYLPIPSDIMDKYNIYQRQIEIEKTLPDFTITVNPSITYIKLNKTSLLFDWSILDSVCWIEVPSAKYTTAYKEGTWDGKYHLFNLIKYQFPTGLLSKILVVLDVTNYTYEIIKNYKEPILHQFNYELSNINFRDYQLTCINTAFTKKRGILQLATGGGKTLLSSGLIQWFGLKTLFLVHTKDLLYQTYNVFKSVFPKETIGIIGDGNLVIGNIIVATIQTLSTKIGYSSDNYGNEQYDVDDNYTEEDIILIKEEKETTISTEMVQELLRNTQLLITDECHHVPAQSMYKIVSNCNTPYKFGLSASPTRDDGFQLKIEAAIGKIIYVISASELIKMGYLVQPHIKCVKVPQVDFPRKITYAQVYQKYIIENETRNQIITLLTQQELKLNHQVLILVKQIRHLNILHELIPNSVIIEGKMKGKERNQIIADLKLKKIQCLIATTIFDEGLDVAGLNVLILAGSGKSSTKAIQRVGRVMRLGDTCPQCQSTDIIIRNKNESCKCKQCGNQFKYHGKENVIVYDFIDQTKWLYEQYHKRLDIYQTEYLYEITKHNVIIK